VVASCALAAGAVTTTVASRAERAQAAWGDTAAVLVARHDLAPGQPVEPGDIEVVPRPVATVPRTALRALPDGAVTRTPVFAGEILVRGRLAPTGLRGVAAAVPPGTRAVAIPRDPATAPPLRVGDRVDVLVALPPEAAGSGPPGFAIATDALVVAVEEAAVTVAVERVAAPRVAVALGQGAVTLSLIGADA
jgi:Flp pilus assembly protein CpaB